MQAPANVPVVPPLANDGLRLIMSNVCGFSQASITRLVEQEGYSSFDEILSFITTKDVQSLGKGLMTQTQNRRVMNAVSWKKLKAIVWWVHDQHRLGIALHYLNFTAQELACSIQELDASDTVAEKAILQPKPLQATNWIPWDMTLMNYLGSLLGKEGIPLDYVLRGVTPPTLMNRHEELVYNAPLHGPAFVADSGQVHQIITSLVQNTSSWTLIETVQRRNCGRTDMLALRHHFDGPDCDITTTLSMTSP